MTKQSNNLRVFAAELIYCS